MSTYTAVLFFCMYDISFSLAYRYIDVQRGPHRRNHLPEGPHLYEQKKNANAADADAVRLHDNKSGVYIHTITVVKISSVYKYSFFFKFNQAVLEVNAECKRGETHLPTYEICTAALK